jgi:hypothetical protein
MEVGRTIYGDVIYEDADGAKARVVVELTKQT